MNRIRSNTHNALRIIGAGVLLSAPGMAAAQRQVPVADQPITVRVQIDRLAADDPEAPARLEGFIRDLQSSEFAARSRAESAIAADPGITLAMIEKALRERGPGLSPDARQRLSTIGRQRFLETPRAAMGIQFWQERSLRDRVVIERTIPNFPDAAAKLEPGDMLIEADGVSLVGPGSRDRLQAIIISHDPGEELPLVVRRGDRKLTFAVRLGRRDTLGQSLPPAPQVLERAWKHRIGNLVETAGEPIRPPVDAQAWTSVPAAFMDRRQDRVLLRHKGLDIGPAVAGGGMARGATQDFDLIARQQLAAFGGRRNAQWLNNQIWINQWEAMQEPAAPAMRPQEELDAMLEARAAAAGGRVGVRPQDGMDFGGQMLRLIDKQIAALRAEMTEQGVPIREPGSSATVPEDAPQKPVPDLP